MSPRRGRHGGTSRVEVKPAWNDVWDRCPYRSLIGPDIGQQTVDHLVAAVACTVAVIDGNPEPLSPTMATDLAAIFQGGGTVLLLSNRTDLRDAAKKEITHILRLVQATAGASA